MTVLVAQVAGEQVGFLALHRHNEASAEIHVMGVDRRHHRQGIGRMLVEAAMERVRGDGCRLLSVKTLAPSRPSESYERTRMFYVSMGFLPLEEIPTLWGKDNPCLILVRPL